MIYLEQSLGQWAAGGANDEGFFANLEQKFHRRLGVEIAPRLVAIAVHRP